jgi:hypothetical protein
MKHELDDDYPLTMPDGTPYNEEQRYGFFVGLKDWQDTKYKRDRRELYPSIENQLDMIWHEISTTGTISNTGEWFTAIQQIKDKFPKL